MHLSAGYQFILSVRYLFFGRDEQAKILKTFTEAISITSVESRGVKIQVDLYLYKLLKNIKDLVQQFSRKLETNLSTIVHSPNLHHIFPIFTASLGTIFPSVNLLTNTNLRMKLGDLSYCTKNTSFICSHTKIKKPPVHFITKDIFDTHRVSYIQFLSKIFDKMIYDKMNLRLFYFHMTMHDRFVFIATIMIEFLPEI